MEGGDIRLLIILVPKVYSVTVHKCYKQGGRGHQSLNYSSPQSISMTLEPTYTEYLCLYAISRQGGGIRLLIILVPKVSYSVLNTWILRDKTMDDELSHIMSSPISTFSNNVVISNDSQILFLFVKPTNGQKCISYCSVASLLYKDLNVRTSIQGGLSVESTHTHTYTHTHTHTYYQYYM